MAALHGAAIASGAGQWLATTTTARVLNVFDRACNLINQDDAVLALVTSERGLTPFALVVSGAEPTPFRGLPADSAVRVDRAAQRLTLASLSIDYGAAVAWQARPDWDAIRPALEANPPWLSGLAGLAVEVELAGSLLDLYQPVPPATAQAGALLRLARQGALWLAQGLSAQDAGQALDGARALAGLGGGLTPAGDDFIVGVLLAAWAGLYGAKAEQLGPPIAAAAAARTTTLSAAYLRSAAQGECMAHWHALFQALAQGSQADVREAVRALVGIGHTSGADALAGFLAVHYGLGSGA